MHTIQLSDDQFEKLSTVVKVAGYEDVPSFLAAIADEPTEDPCGELSETELRESVEMIRRGNAAIEAGEGIDAEEAFRKIGEKHGFDIP